MDGHWLCRSCAKPVALNLDGEQSRCAECGSTRLHFLGGENRNEPSRTLRIRTSRPLRVSTPHSALRIPHSQSATLFAALRASVD